MAYKIMVCILMEVYALAGACVTRARPRNVMYILISSCTTDTLADSAQSLQAASLARVIPCSIQSKDCVARGICPPLAILVPPLAISGHPAHLPATGPTSGHPLAILVPPSCDQALALELALLAKVLFQKLRHCHVVSVLGHTLFSAPHG